MTTPTHPLVAKLREIAEEAFDRKAGNATRLHAIADDLAALLAELEQDKQRLASALEMLLEGCETLPGVRDAIDAARKGKQ